MPVVHNFISNENTRMNKNSSKASGQMFVQGADLIGKAITAFTLYLSSNFGVNSGNVIMGVYDNDTGDLITNFRTIDASKITTIPTAYEAKGVHILKKNQVLGYKWVE
jgi:hypothetical protein